MATTARKPAAAKPQSQATSHASKKQQAHMVRLGAFALLALLVVFPYVPSPLLGVDWMHTAAPGLKVLTEKMPPEPIVLLLFTLQPQQIGQWLYWGLAAFLTFVALTLVMHVGALYAQRTRPLGQRRTYLRLTVPTSAPAKPADAVTLLKSLHGMVPPNNPMQPTLAPLMLCWTARPERKIQQAISIAGPDATTTSLQKRLQGIASGTKVVAIDDPLLAELKSGRFLCVAEARTIAGDTMPIAIVSREQTLLTGLLPALAPQAGVVLASARIIQEPIPDRLWRLDVLALLERMKLDTGTDEQQALKAKASGPAFRSRFLLIAVADDPQAGAAQVVTMGAALAASTQSIALTSQRLQAGPVQVFPAVVPPRLPLPRVWKGSGLIGGVLIAVMLTFFLWRSGMTMTHPFLWAVPPLMLWLPVLSVAAVWRKRTDADLPLRHAAILGGLLPARNPRVVPIWWPWLGHNS